MSDQEVFESQDPEAGSGGRQNVRSTIAFPYSPLQDAEQVARALRQRGDTAAMDEVAAEMQQTVTSGAFRTKMATARIFGVIEVSRGQVTLTSLGHRLVDPAQVEQARVDAFLHVPLFKQVYEEYRGRNLPPAKGLEKQIERLGVSPKQVDRARQALMRSAEQAGFFRTSGTDRLVQPMLGSVSGAFVDGDQPGAGGGSSDAGDLRVPAWTTQMWLTLLEDGADWSPEQLKKYVDGARAAYKAMPK